MWVLLSVKSNHCLVGCRRQVSFWYVLEPPLAGQRPGTLLPVPQLPAPNTGLVQLTLVTDAMDTPYTMSIWAVTQVKLQTLPMLCCRDVDMIGKESLPCVSVVV